MLPAAHLALHPQMTVVELDDASRKCQPEPGSLLLRRTSSTLLERLEDPLAVLGWHARTVVDHVDGDRRRVDPSADPDLLGRELDRIRKQVEHHLLEAQFVGGDDVDGGIHVQLQPHGSLCGPLPDHRHAVLERLTDVDKRHVELHPSGLDLREVEDVVEELEQVLARLPDVADVLLLAVVEITEHPLEEHLGEPDDGVQRRAQLVGHAGEELRLVLARDLELDAPLLELPVEAGVDDGERGLAGERLEQVAGLLSEAPGDQAANGEGPDDAVVTEDRHRDDRTPAGVQQDAEVGVQVHLPEVGYLVRLALPGRPPDDRVVKTNSYAPQRAEDRRAGPELGPHAELLGQVVVLEDGATVCRRQQHSVHDDRGQDLFGIEARAHRLADVAERLELVDLPAQVLLPGVQGPHQVHVADRDRGLVGERRKHLRRPIGKGGHLGPPGREHADDLSVEEHRHTEDGPVVADPLDIMHGVLGVVEDVGDLLGPPIEADPADKAPPVQRDLLAKEEVPILVGVPNGRGQAELVSFEEVDLGHIGVAQTTSALHHRAQDRIEVGGRSTQRREHLIGGDELGAGLVEVVCEPFELSRRRAPTRCGHSPSQA